MAWALCRPARPCNCWSAILRSAPPRPSTRRVYFTAEASARNSRWRLTAACSRRPAAQPSEPTAIKPRAEQGAGAAAALVVGLPQRHAQAPDHLQAPDHADQAHVQACVAVHQVAELVRHHALQFGARQAFERAARDGDHRVVGMPSRRRRR